MAERLNESTEKNAVAGDDGNPRLELIFAAGRNWSAASQGPQSDRELPPPSLLRPSKAVTGEFRIISDVPLTSTFVQRRHQALSG
jgi:hypothetical protein